MGGNISVGNENSSSDSISFGDNSAVDSFGDSPAEQNIAQAERTNPFDEMQAVVDQLRGQNIATDVAPNVLSNSAAEPAPTTSSLLSERFTDRLKTLDDQELANEIKSKEAQLKERNEQLQLAEQTEDNAGAIANGLGLAAGILGLGGSLARGIASVAAGFGISVAGEDLVAGVAGNSADVAFDEAARLGVEVAALKSEQQQRAEVPQPLSGEEVTGEIPDRPNTVQSLPEQIASERNTAIKEREKQRQFENIAATDPSFRDQALQEAANAATRAGAAEQRADQLQAQQDEKVTALAAAEEKAALEAAEKAREQSRREQSDRSEPNGGQVSGADRGVGRGDVPDSF